MKTTTTLLPVFAAALAACASHTPFPAGYSPPYTNPTMTHLVEFPAVPRPANDLSETDRARWFEEQRPVIEAFDDRRIVYVESEPMPCYDRPTLLDWLWALPISLSFGYWSGGGHHDHDGWGVGTTIGGWH